MMPFHCMRFLLVLGPVVAQVLFEKENKFLAQHGLAMQPVNRNETNSTAQAEHDWWVFQITMASNGMLCLDNQGEISDNGNPITLWECNGHESQLWYFDEGSYQIVWAGNSMKCLDAGDQQGGTATVLWDCNGLPQQKWGFDDGAIFLFDLASDAALCLDVQGGSMQSGTLLEIWECNNLDGQKFALQAGIAIRSTQNYKMCLDLPGGDTTNGKDLWMWECNGGWGQYWIFDTDANYAIKFASDLTKCLDAGDNQVGNKLMIWDCNGKDSQAFGYDVNTGTLYLAWSTSDATLCVDIFGGDLVNGGAVDIWNCNDCWNQQFQAYGPSSLSMLTLGDKVAEVSKKEDGLCPDVPGGPSPSPGVPSDVYMPDCSKAAPNWPIFNSPSELQANAEWSSYFQNVYGEIPSIGYPICVGAFTQIPNRGGLTSFSPQHCKDTTLGSSGNGQLVDEMSDCCDPKSGSSRLATYIYNEMNTRHAVPDNTWFESQHVTKGGDGSATWYYLVFGSAIWVYTGNTIVFTDHPDATSYFLGSTCKDKNHKTTPATECEWDFAGWFSSALSQGLDSIQFTDHFDCGCGENGWSSWDKNSKLCNTEIIDLHGDGSKACGSYKAGWAAQRDCNCDSSKKWGNCQGYGI